MLDLTADFGVKSKTQIWRQFLSEDGRVELDLRGGALDQPTTTTVSVHTPGYIHGQKHKKGWREKFLYTVTKFPDGYSKTVHYL